MRDECSKAKWKDRPLIGRKLDLCEGKGFDGRENPLQQDSDSFRRILGLEPIQVQEPQARQILSRRHEIEVPQLSQVGTRLAEIFHESWGAIPCGDCKAALKELNGMTVEQIQKDRDYWVNRITANSKKAAPKYWQKIALSADQFMHLGGTEYLIGRYLDDACDCC